jgi:hypothetical protein
VIKQFLMHLLTTRESVPFVLWIVLPVYYGYVACKENDENQGRMIAHRGQTIGQNVLNSGIESSCFARILKMEEQLIFGGPIYFFARLFFGR